MLGVFLGSAIWWLTLSEGVTLFRKKVSQNVMSWINRIAGLIIFGFGIAQKNKFAEVMNSKKLGMMIKKVNDKDKEDYYQQFYWLRKAEELKSYPHLAGIKPKVFYTFVKEINPQIPTKELDAKKRTS